MKLIKKVVDYILPPRCLSCASLTIDDDGFCAECWHSLNFITKPCCNICGKRLELNFFEEVTCARCLYKKPSYDLARSLLKFDENSKKLIHMFKYYDKTVFAKVFAKLLYKSYEREMSSFDIIVPVPMHKVKRLIRMYNQAQILALALSKLLGKQLCSDLLKKHKWTKSQTSLSRKQRVQNISDSIIFNKKYSIQNKNIMLIDDVLTTGATIEKCSALLKKSGAKKVFVITIAMT